MYVELHTDEIYHDAAIVEPASGPVEVAVLPIRRIVRLELRDGLYVVVVAGINDRVTEDEEGGACE